MRTALLVTPALALLIAGGTCFPLVDTTLHEPPSAQKLVVTLAEPSETRTVPEGTAVDIEWHAANNTGYPAKVTFRAESRKDLSLVDLPWKVEFEGSGGSGTQVWNTDGYSGPYAIIARIEAGGLTREEKSAGIITVDAPPKFEFTAPAGNVRFDPGKGDKLTISWAAEDESATARIGVDPDTDHQNNNELYIHDADLSESGSAGTKTPGSSETTPSATRTKSIRPQQSKEDQPSDASADGSADASGVGTWQGPGGGTTTGQVGITTGVESGGPQSGTLEWDGKTTDGKAVEPGTYNLFARVSDDVNEVLYVEGPGQITIAEAASETDPNAQGPQITKPETDTEFLTTTETLRIEYQPNMDEDVLVDIKIDTDDQHANGNERTILSQQFVAADSKADPFEWNGKDSAGAAVGAGIYRIFMLATTEGGSTETAEAKGLVFRRSDPNQPLIALLEPKSTVKVDPGDTVTITWRDEDPAGNAKIRIVVASTPNPDEHASDVPIMSDRKASDDGVRDTFTWQIPTSSGLLPGTLYYVIAYIVNDDAGRLGSNSVAPGRVILKDPTKP